MLPLDDEGVAYALVALRKIATFPESTNFFQENPGKFLFFKKIALPLRFRYSKRKTTITENNIEN